MGKGRPTTDYYTDMQMFMGKDYNDWTTSCESLARAYRSYETNLKRKVETVSKEITRENKQAEGYKDAKVDKGTCTDSLSDAVSKLNAELEKKADKTNTKYAGDIGQNATLEQCLADAEKKVKEYKEKKDKKASFDPVPSLSVTGASATATGVSAGLTGLSIAGKFLEISIYGYCFMMSGVAMGSTGVSWKNVTNKSAARFTKLLLTMGFNRNGISFNEAAVNDVGAALANTSAGAVRTAVGLAMNM